MSNNKYIVKSLTPWMIDELIAFSSLKNFDLILLRKPEEFYEDSLEKIKNNGVIVLIEPFAFNFVLKKFIILFKFLFLNILKFDFSYNMVLGLKSMFWFFKLDLKIFSKESNIHAQFATQPAIIALLVKNFYSKEPKFSFTFHAYDIYFNNKWFKTLIDNCQWAFSISNFNMDYVQKKFVNSDRIVLSRLGVFRNTIHKDDRKESVYFTLGLMSWFWEKKGIGYLLEAFNLLKEKGYNNIRLLLAGDGPLKEKFISYIQENKLSEHVKLIGKIKGSKKDEFYNSLDVFALPSVELENDKDGIPVVLMEAIAYSLPIISTDVSGIPEICIDDYNGKLVEERNVDAIVKAILEIYSNSIKSEKYAKNSKKLSKKYDIEINSKRKLETLNWV